MFTSRPAILANPVVYSKPLRCLTSVIAGTVLALGILLRIVLTATIWHIIQYCQIVKFDIYKRNKYIVGQAIA